ncbi:tyrosine--tRNA ligase [Mycoplasma procyoni]|uniref:tyrosine--tRNA ligase n=1 Tax=Mycoplasma procyoni TaxID=568784 RepID=UPI00197B228E|nr:tyrosine--tRNA ligase [Mycoplasma procyoni]MBN3534385.1 tyrosine--tRNA ligase [Mycoplasma procyoni]
MKKALLEEFKQRGILNNITSEEKFLEIKENEAIYGGFDPTAISLHLGNYVQINTLLRLKKAGIKAIAVIGGATAMIGDPSFKNAERQLLDFDKVEQNKKAIIKQLESFGLEVVDNYDFYKNMNILEFLRVVGKYLNVSYMLSKDSVATRLESGLSFTEFSYQLIQGWDFNVLYETKNVVGQMGGSDQWGNIVSGTEIIRKKHGENNKSFAFTTNLLVDKNGQKYGKSTGGGSLWLDKNLTSPFQMYQFLLNSDDQEIETLLKRLTFLDLSEINSLLENHNQNKAQRLAQKTLAYEVIKDIHGQKEALNSQKITEILFANSDFSKLEASDLDQLKNSIPVFEAKATDLICNILLENKIVSSKRELREFLAAGTLSMNNQKIQTEDQLVDSSMFESKYALIKKGKRNYFLLELKK